MFLREGNFVKRITKFVLCFVIASLAFFSTSSGALAQTIDQFLFTDYNGLVTRLTNLEANSNGKVKVEVIGQSNLGRDIFMVEVGRGDISVMIMAQQHGSERTSAEAVLMLVEELGTSEDPVVANILEQLTVYVVPRVNVDGGEVGVWTYCNVDPSSPPNWDEFGISGRYPTGWNPSRYHVPEWEDHPLSKYEEPALEFGNDNSFIPGKAFSNSVDYEGTEGILVNCGRGTAFPEKVKGNIALIESGGGGDLDVIARNAAEAGAVAAIFYQDKDYEYTDQANFLPRFGFKGEVPIPAMTIPRVDALKFMFRGDTSARIFKNTYPENPVPEAQAVVNAVLKVQPSWLIDVHNTNSVISPTGRTATAALSWGGRMDPATPQDTIDTALRLCVAMADRMHETYDYAEVIRYYTRPWPGWPTARDAYTRELNIPSVLIELWIDNTPVYAPTITIHGYEMLLTALEKTADGTLSDVDPNRVNDLSGWGATVSGSIARDNMAPVYMASVYKTEIANTIAAIDSLPEVDDLTLLNLGQVTVARDLVQELAGFGVPPTQVTNYRKLVVAEEKMDELSQLEWLKEESLFTLDVPGVDQRKLMGYFITYDNDSRWTSDDTINGVNFSPLKMYTVSHSNLKDQRWIVYDIESRGFDLVQGYVGVADRSANTTRPLDFMIFIDEQLAFEAHLEYGEDAQFYQLNIKDAKTIKFQLSTESTHEYVNRIAIVEPMFIAIDIEKGIRSAEDAIAKIPANVSSKDMELVTQARLIVDKVASFGYESEISNLLLLVEIEKALEEK